MPPDDLHLRRAIRLAMTGRGKVEPNPMVGCVIVKDGRVIGEGYHQQYGGPHAEPNAIHSCTESPAGATAYVTLEPCSHTNKQTPPCAPLLIQQKIARVVVGSVDPNPPVNGNGIRMLREAGIVVDRSPLEAECRQLIAAFIASTASRPPYLTMKWAESADGNVAGAGGRRRQISNVRSSRAVQGLRGRCQGIVVGVNTVLNDDPTLFPRDVPIPGLYDRIVLDTHLRTPPTSQLIQTRGTRAVTIVCGPGLSVPDGLELDHVRIVDDQPLDRHGRVSLPAWIRSLFPYDHLMVEPGPTLASAIAPLADRLWIIRSPRPIGDGVPAAAVPDYYVAAGTVDLDGDILTEYLNTRSSVYFAPVPSADLVLTTDPV